IRLSQSVSFNTGGSNAFDTATNKCYYHTNFLDEEEDPEVETSTEMGTAENCAQSKGPKWWFNLQGGGLFCSALLSQLSSS
ncbi:unnamed protein product, partial [Ilex paraguariensis]